MLRIRNTIRTAQIRKDVKKSKMMISKFQDICS